MSTSTSALFWASLGSIALFAGWNAPAAYADDLAETNAESVAATELTPDQKRMKEMREEVERLELEYRLMQQRQRNELLEQELHQQRLNTETQAKQAEHRKKLAALQSKLEFAETTAALERTKHQAELAETRAEVERLRTKAELESTRRQGELTRLAAETERLNARNGLLQAQLQSKDLDASDGVKQLQRRVQTLQAELELRDARDRRFDIVVDEADYRLDPYDDGTVYISDRRIPLNGPIISGTADYVTERIHYFNNQSKEAPIFIVIDSCPGGSVMQGYRIVQAMQHSDAPVHVVVKSYAASMAAVITTLADHSYAYPNAVILHHQMSSGMFGNLTQQAEQLERANEWARRLAQPVADRMGVSLERFTELMYENNSTGDWDEFADRAKDLNWVNTIVTEIRETGVRDRPTNPAPTPFFWWQAQEIDDEGQPFVRLPRLDPFDFYAIHNPDGYYRTP